MKSYPTKFKSFLWKIVQMGTLQKLQNSIQALIIFWPVYSILVQSLNSTFFPPHIGAEPGRAKEESRITCMRMLRTPPFFPPKSGEKPYLEVFFRFGLWRDFLNDNIQATISAFRLIKTMSINPRLVEFHQCHAKPHSICFLITLSKITKEVFAKIC